MMAMAPWICTLHVEEPTTTGSSHSPRPTSGQLRCRFCGTAIEPIEAWVDGEVWWRCPHCAALLERKVGGAR